MADIKIEKRLKRKKKIRSRVGGTKERPRLAVFRSNKYIFAQLIDDTKGITLAAASGLLLREKGKSKSTTNKVHAAGIVGANIAKAAKSKKIKKVVFDRGGYKYHGQVKALAEAARKEGLEF
jgi:large subunit ribosomal protein L18